MSTLSEPLVRSHGFIGSPPPSHAFQIRDRFSTEEIEEQQDKYWKQFPMVAIIGFLTGLIAICFNHMVQSTLDMWYRFQIGGQGDTAWIVFAGLGGLVTGIILRLQRKTFVHDFSIRQLEIRAEDAPTVVIAGTVALLSAAPFGPEVVIVAAATILTTKVQTLLNSTIPDVSISSTLGSLVPCPYIGPIVSFECNRGETMTQVTASLSAYFAAALLRKLIGSESNATWATEQAFKPWYYFVALALGLVGSFCGILVLTTAALARQMRAGFTHRLRQNQSPSWCPTIFCCTTGGLLHGILSAYFPLAGGVGWKNIEIILSPGSFGSFPILTLIGTIVAKVVGTASGLSLGLVGGSVWPMAYIGILVGVLLTNVLPIFPASITVPCCVVASIVSTVSLPISTSIVTALLLNLDPQYSAAALLSALVSQYLTHGTGLSQYFCRDIHESLLDDDESEDEDVPATPSDHEILQDVRSRIFGSQNTI